MYELFSINTLQKLCFNRISNHTHPIKTSATFQLALTWVGLILIIVIIVIIFITLIIIENRTGLMGWCDSQELGIEQENITNIVVIIIVINISIIIIIFITLIIMIPISTDLRWVDVISRAGHWTGEHEGGGSLQLPENVILIIIWWECYLDNYLMTMLSWWYYLDIILMILSC